MAIHSTQAANCLKDRIPIWLGASDDAMLVRIIEEPQADLLRLLADPLLRMLLQGLENQGLQGRSRRPPIKDEKDVAVPSDADISAPFLSQAIRIRYVGRGGTSHAHSSQQCQNQPEWGCHCPD